MELFLEMFSYVMCCALGAYLYQRAYKQGVDSQKEKIESLQRYIRQRNEADRHNADLLRKDFMAEAKRTARKK